MGTGAITIDHAAVDALPRSRTTEIIRSQLVATGCLPHRNSYAADFQSWLNAYLAGRPFSGYVARQTRGPAAPRHRR